MRSRTHFSLICFTALLPLLNSCTSAANNKSSKAEGPAAAVETRTFQATGTVKALDPKAPSIEIDHQDIKGLMPAMQMWFHVKDTSVIEGVSAGDRVEFSIESGVGGLKIVAIKKI